MNTNYLVISQAKEKQTGIEFISALQRELNISCARHNEKE